MPAYIHGTAHYTTKLVSVHEQNVERGLPPVQAQIAITNAETGRLVAYMHGERITNARTGCIGGLSTCELARTPVTLALIGTGTQARWQARAIAAATDIETIRVYSPSDSKDDCAADLSQTLDVTTTAVDTPSDAIRGATVAVTATSADPVFPGEALNPGTLVIAIGAYTSEMQELDSATVENATRVFADVPQEAAEIGDIQETEINVGDLIPLAEVLAGEEQRTIQEENLVVESVGSAVLDAAAGEYIVRAATEADLGVSIQL